MLEFLQSDPSVTAVLFAVAVVFGGISAWFVRLMGRSTGSAVWSSGAIAILFAGVVPTAFVVARLYVTG